GEEKDDPDFEEHTVKIGDQDILFLYTDGLTEGMNATGEMFGKKRMRALVEGNTMNGPQKMIEELIRGFMEHNGEKPLDDDVTCAAALLLPSGGGSRYAPG
ncbi:MAG TPA: SpoIIE family protein phosphatase, partial [Bdellovibrionota bacterium]|nr:SpoIIE family protein phosphatase [Bdellovibrionota bacterium]